MRDQFDVFGEGYEIMQTGIFAGHQVGGRVLHRSNNRTHLTIATKYPQRMHGRYGAEVDYHETFFVFKGTGRRTYPDGTVVEMKKGDLVYVRPGVDLIWEYDPGFADVAFFWSDRALPMDLDGGLLFSPPK